MSALPAVEVRPQTALLIFFGDHVASDDGTRRLVAGADVLAVLGRLGVGEHAGRATLARMVRRGLLERTMRGRSAWFGLTERGRTTMLDGRRRGQEAGRRDGAAAWDGRWTFVAFSMPETFGAQRHDLRSRLTWAGFGLVQGGLWVAPRMVDVPALLDGLDGGEHVRAFVGEPAAPTDAARLVAEAYDLDALAAGFVAFDARWRPLVGGLARHDDPLVAQLLLTADWLGVVRADPRLPERFLPADWPAWAAGDLYRTLLTHLTPRLTPHLPVIMNG